MRTAKHLALEKFEPIDMSLGDPIAPLGRASGANSGIISTNPVDKTGEFGYMTGFSSLEPGVQSLRMAFFEHANKLLAQGVNGAEFLVAVHLRNLLLLHFRQFRGW